MLLEQDSYLHRMIVGLSLIEEKNKILIKTSLVEILRVF